MDKFTKEVRSKTMMAVKSRGNKSTELALIQLFKKHSIKGWRRHSRLFGRPDFYFPKLKLALFADGCFWHGCACRQTKPQNNAAYWENKIRRNKARDRLVTHELKSRGYVVLRIKECEIKKGTLPRKLLSAFA